MSNFPFCVFYVFIQLVNLLRKDHQLQLDIGISMSTTHMSMHFLQVDYRWLLIMFNIKCSTDYSSLLANNFMCFFSNKWGSVSQIVGCDPLGGHEQVSKDHELSTMSWKVFPPLESSRFLRRAFCLFIDLWQPDISRAMESRLLRFLQDTLKVIMSDMDIVKIIKANLSIIRKKNPEDTLW